MSSIIWILVFVGLGLATGFLLLRWATRWGSTPLERAATFPGDEYLEGGPPVRTVMTRAVSVSVPPERVWPWIAQLGRGAGWYSIDWLDNGRRTSAWHLVSWIPEPKLGDATAIGYLRHLDSGRSIVWWVDGVRFFGSRARLVTYFGIEAEDGGARLVSRMSADAAGPFARIALLVFRAIDSIMACRQLMGLRKRIEHWGADSASARELETGARDQYQLYEVLYASGQSAGVAGKEHSDRWRRSALADDILNGPS